MRSDLDVPAAPLIDADSVSRVVLGNGLTVLIRRDTSAPVVAIVTHVKAGYFDETDDVAGIAHVLEHMYFKGTARRGVGEIARETKASGGYLNASTIYDHTVYTTVLPASGLAAGIDIQADAYSGSLIDADELAKELEVIIQEAKRKTDSPSAVVTETLFAVLHDQHRMRRWRIGHEDGLRAMTRDDLVRFYRNFYRPRNTILAIAGDVDPDHVLPLVERAYGGVGDVAVARTPGPEEPDWRGFRFREMSGDIAQTETAFGWRTPGTLHDDTPALEVAAVVLGGGRASRLYRAVRERKLASSVSAYDYTPTEIGVFVVHAESLPDTSEEAARAMWHQVRALRDDGPTEAELERARRLFEARWLRQLETMEGQAGYLTEWEALGDWRLGESFHARAMSASAAQVQVAARTWLAEDQAGLVVYRPAAAAPFATTLADARARLADPRPAALEPLAPRESSAVTAHAASPALEREAHGVRVYRTRAGVPLLVRRKPGAPLVHIGAYTMGGGAHEPADLGGLLTILSRGSLKGTTQRSAARIAEDSENLGGSISVGVSLDTAGWSFSVPTRQLAPAVELLADVLMHPVFPAEAIETERGVALAQLRSLRDDMYRYPMRLAMQSAFGTHPYGRSLLGSEASLEAISRDAVAHWHGEQMLGWPWVLAVVGDVDGDEVAGVLATHFDELQAGAPPVLGAPAWPSRLTSAVETRDKAQTALAIAFEGASRSMPARFAMQLIAGIASGLGGRFFDQLRDKQSLAYTVHAHAVERVQGGLFVAYIATSPEREDEARGGLLAEFEKLRDGLVTAEELTRAQTYAIGTHAISQQSGASVLGEIVDAWLFGDLDELESYDPSVRGVTREEILALARRYFDPERRVEGVVRGVGRVV